MKDPILIKAEYLTDDLGVEQYEDNSLRIVNLEGASVEIVPKDLQGVIERITGGTGICNNVMVDINPDGSVEIMNNTGKEVKIKKEELQQFESLLRLFFGSIRGTF